MTEREKEYNKILEIPPHLRTDAERKRIREVEQLRNKIFNDNLAIQKWYAERQSKALGFNEDPPNGEWHEKPLDVASPKRQPDPLLTKAARRFWMDWDPTNPNWRLIVAVLLVSPHRTPTTIKQMTVDQIRDALNAHVVLTPTTSIETTATANVTLPPAITHPEKYNPPSKTSGQADSSPEPQTRTPDSDLSPSRIKARAAYDWAMSEILGAEKLTVAELFEAIQRHPSGAGEALPPNADTFAKYLRDAGIKRYGKAGDGRGSKGVRHRDQI